MRLKFIFQTFLPEQDVFTALCFLPTLNMQYSVSFKKSNMRTRYTPSLKTLLTFGSAKALMTSLFFVKKKKKHTEEKRHEYFVRWVTLYHLFFLSLKVLSLTAKVSFELTHQWCIKGCGDDRESIKSRSLGDEGVGSVCVGGATTWKSAEWQGARFLQTLRLKVTVCLLVLASPSVN